MPPHVAPESWRPAPPPPHDAHTVREPAALKTAIQGPAARERPDGNVNPSRRRTQVRPSAQLTDFLHSPSTQDIYTGVAAAVAGRSGPRQRVEKMKKYLDGWTTDWDAIDEQSE